MMGKRDAEASKRGLRASQPTADAARPRSQGGPVALHLLCQGWRRARGYQTGCKPGLAGLVCSRIGAGALGPVN